MIDWTKPVRTVGSKTPVKILSLEGPGKMSVVGYLMDGDADICTWYPGGGFSVDPLSHCMDLENVPERSIYSIEAASVWGITDIRLQVCIIKEIQNAARSEVLFAACTSHAQAETILHLLNATNDRL